MMIPSVNAGGIMSYDTLFPRPDEEAQAPVRAPVPKAAPRLQRPDRAEVELRPVSLESLVSDDHQVRAVWEYVQRLDLSAIHA